MKIEHDVKLGRTAPEYAQILKSAREQQGLAQKDVANKLGLSAMGLSHFERGERVPRIDQFEDWAVQLGFEVHVTLKTAPISRAQ